MGLLQNSWYMQNMAFRTQESYPYIVYKLDFATAPFCPNRREIREPPP